MRGRWAEGFVGSMGNGRSAPVSAGGDGVAYCMSWSEELRAFNPVLDVNLCKSDAPLQRGRAGTSGSWSWILFLNEG